MIRRISAAQARSWLPRRPGDVSKGDVGRVYILAGSCGMIGAGILCSMGAVRAGAGLIRFGTVKSQQGVAARRAPLEVMTEALPEAKGGHLSPRALPAIKKALRQFRPDILALGPGLGQSPEVKKIIHRMVKEETVSIVLDADGLNAFQEEPEALRRHRAPLIITPHPGELGRLLGVSPKAIQSNRALWARRAALRFRCVCLLKGAGTIISDGRTHWKNATGNPAMASGGMGDVLTGLIAGLWGQMNLGSPRQALAAAALGAYLHGRAGDLALKKLKQSRLIASEVAAFLPKAMGVIASLPAAAGKLAMTT
ncbi:MAG: NAD(P)H-hydrate dehydratase [Elusimicrobia bacterium]|nr:NAD(P)H-hydrate dehydratase [Candidatus Obscuribacterium magneticum]MCB4755861.1 NAD(P)H-hydrate dehydratase [Candidatus Obscuribacterium magneticum]